MKITYYPHSQSILTGSSRQRVFLIQRWLLDHGIEARISSAPFDSDIIVIQKCCTQDLLNIIRRAKTSGIITVFDEDDLFWCSCALEADYITVDTPEKIEWLRQKTSKKLRCKVIKDLLDYLETPLPKRKHKEKETLKIVMFANPENLRNVEVCLPALLILKKEGRKFTFTYISGNSKQKPTYQFPKELEAKWIPWDLNTYSETLRKFDLALVPQIIPQKGPAKLIEAIGHNLAVVGTAIPSVKEWAKETKNEEFICMNTEEWLIALNKMWDHNVRNAQLERTLPWIWKNRSLDVIAQTWLVFFEEIMRKKEKKHKNRR